MATTPRAGTVRILTLTNWYPPHHFGGYELSCYDVMRRLEQRGHEVTVLCSAQRRGGVNDDDADAQHERHVHRDLELWIEDDVLVRPSFSRRLQIERHNQAVLRKVLERGTFDVVSVWHMGAMSVGLLTTIAERQLPVVYAVCDDWLIYVLSQDRWAGLFTGARWRRAAGRALHPLVRVPTVPPDLSQTGAFCFVSEFTRGCAQAMSQWSFPISTVVFSGIERAEFAPIPAPERRWRDRLLYVGRFDRRKGLETLIRAVALLPPTT
ncbi:MAG: glycogen synthase, partial [Acidimicrobiaceae bacterium]